MDLTKTPPALATEAAEAIRALNHLTIGLDHKGYEHPAEAGATAYALRTLAERLPQTLDQLSTALVRFANEDAIRMDDGTDPIQAVAECTGRLAVARPILGQLIAELATVSARTSHMGGHWPADDEDDVDADAPRDPVELEERLAAEADQYE